MKVKCVPKGTLCTGYPQAVAQQELLLPPGTFTGEVRRPIDDTIEELGGAPSIVNVYYHNFTNYFITYFDSTI